MGDILVVNAGSTSLKLHVVDADERARRVERLADVPAEGLDAVAHRVVHGGPSLREPVLVDASVRERIFELESLAPLHNAPALAGIDEAERRFPDLPHVAVFDTAFHATMPEEARLYAVPSRWREWGVRRYGFHGLSVAWSAERAPELLGRPPEELRLVVCHLGGGCSVTAVQAGRSVDTTMGFSPLEGVPMATRSGSLDPAAVLYLLRRRGLEPGELEHELSFDAGLKALGGGSGGVRELEARARAGDADAGMALGVFAHRVGQAAAAMAVAAGGLDALVFTAGIGEGSAYVRADVCARLALLGVELEAAANEGATPDCDVAAAGSAVRILVVHAREELVAAREARALLTSAS